jgi:hypothetical protein
MLLNKLFRTPKNQVSTPRPECGVGFDSSARAMNRDTKENVSLVSFERKQMLNTLKRKIALVAVSAVGMSGLALMSAPAANATPTGITSVTTQPTRNSSLALDGFVGETTETGTANKVVVSVTGTTDTTGALNLVVGETVTLFGRVLTAPTAAAVDSLTQIAAGDTVAAVGYMKAGVASSFTLAASGEVTTVLGSTQALKKGFRAAGTYSILLWIDDNQSAGTPAILSGDEDLGGNEAFITASISIGGLPTSFALSSTSATAAGTSPGAVTLTLKDTNGVPTLLQGANEKISILSNVPALSTETQTVRRGTALAFNTGSQTGDSVTVATRVAGTWATRTAAGINAFAVASSESITASAGSYNYRVDHTGAMVSTVTFNLAGSKLVPATPQVFTFSTAAGGKATKLKVTNASGVHFESSTVTNVNNARVYTAPVSTDTASLSSYIVNPSVTTISLQLTGTAAAIVNVTVEASTTAGVTVGTTQVTLDAAGLGTAQFTATTASGAFTVSVPTADGATRSNITSVFTYETAGYAAAAALGKNGISTDILSSTVTSVAAKVGATTVITTTVKDQYGTPLPYYSVKGVLSSTSRNVAATFPTAYTGADGKATTTLVDASTSTTNLTDVLTINVATPGTAVTSSLITGNVLTITYSATGAYATLAVTGGSTSTVTVTKQVESVTGSTDAMVTLTPSLKDSSAVAVSGVGLTYTGSEGVFFRAVAATRPTTGDVTTMTKGSTTPVFAYATKPGTATVTITGGGLTTTATWTVSAAVASTARVLTSAAAAGRVTATVKDGWGNPVAGVTVSFASDNKGIFGNGTSSTSALTDSSGLASALVQSADGTGADVAVIASFTGAQSAAVADDNVTGFGAGAASVTVTAKPTAGAASTDTAITAVKTDVATANAAVKALATQVTVLQASVATLIDSLTTQIASLMKSVSALTKAVAKLQTATKKK